ncbi:MAG: hypothetical protein IJ558_06350 [Treponema sp.]|nr:hypothetical protein [Treponema sp.]
MTPADIELFGRKTFFIAPDTSLIPKNYLEEFMARGYQTYIINDDYTCSIQSKVREITRLYPESILYFNIDATIDGIEWKSYIRELHEFLGEQTLIGIFYHQRADSAEEERIKTYFVRDVRIRAGCFSLSAHNHENFDSILAVLEQSGAKGRRNLVRANCNASSTVKFEHKGSGYTARLLDVNVTHFRCDLQGSTEQFAIFEKIQNATLYVNGVPFMSDVVLIMKRTSGGKNLCIFMFIKSDGTPDLDGETAKKLNQKIYQIVLDETMAVLQNAFRTADR